MASGHHHIGDPGSGRCWCCLSSRWLEPITAGPLTGLRRWHGTVIGWQAWVGIGTGTGPRGQRNKCHLARHDVARSSACRYESPTRMTSRHRPSLIDPGGKPRRRNDPEQPKLHARPSEVRPSSLVVAYTAPRRSVRRRSQLCFRQPAEADPEQRQHRDSDHRPRRRFNQ